MSLPMAALMAASVRVAAPSLNAGVVEMKIDRPLG